MGWGTFTRICVVISRHLCNLNRFCGTKGSIPQVWWKI